MSRQFPRFLFSNPKNTKSEGPFIVHLLEPKMICRLNFTPSNEPQLQMIKCWDSEDITKQAFVLNAMLNWVKSKIITKEIEIPKSPGYEIKWTLENEAKKIYPDDLPTNQ